MKQAGLILLIFVYAFSTTGVALKADYCCDNLKSVKLVLADGAKDINGCCTIKYQSFKVKDAHAASDVITSPALYYTFVHTLDPLFEINNPAFEKTYRVVNIHAPPLYAGIPVYISNSIFRI